LAVKRELGPSDGRPWAACGRACGQGDASPATRKESHDFLLHLWRALATRTARPPSPGQPPAGARRRRSVRLASL